MIHYQLRCSDGHDFDGWFPGSAAFDRQCGAGQVECPSCGSVRVARALMAPSLSRGAIEVLPPEPPKKPAPPAEMMAALQRLRETVERNCEDVGDNFASQARQMHHGEIEHRGIYGQTNAEEAELLRDEGIAIARLPWVPRADS